MTLSLPRKKREIFQFIRRFIDLNTFSPTLTDIAKQFNVNLPTAHEHLEYLRNHGLIEFKEGKSGKIAPKDIEGFKSSDNTVDVPVLGFITAGEPIEAIENKDDGIPVPKDMVYGRDCYLLKVRGDSMIESFIMDGDIVVVEKTSHANNGETVVAMLEDGTATLKKFYKEGQKIRLQPANSLYKPIYLDNVEIQGKIVGLLRKYR